MRVGLGTLVGAPAASLRLRGPVRGGSGNGVVHIGLGGTLGVEASLHVQCHREVRRLASQPMAGVARFTHGCEALGRHIGVFARCEGFFAVSAPLAKQGLQWWLFSPECRLGCIRCFCESRRYGVGRARWGTAALRRWSCALGSSGVAVLVMRGAHTSEEKQ